MWNNSCRENLGAGEASPCWKTLTMDPEVGDHLVTVDYTWEITGSSIPPCYYLANIPKVWLKKTGKIQEYEYDLLSWWISWLDI